MIYTMSRDLEKRLQARKYPVKVHYAPERTGRDGAGRATVIVVRRDREQGDGPPRAVVGVERNPRKIGVRDLGVIADIYAASNAAGAMIQEHEFACDFLVDAFLVSLYQWGAESGAGAIPVTESRYLTDEERKDEEIFPGVVYRLRFRVPRAIKSVDYRGNGAPEALLEAVATTARVTTDGENFEEI